MNLFGGLLAGLLAAALAAPAPPAQPAEAPGTPAEGEAPKKKKRIRKIRKVEGEEVELKTTDGWTLSGTYKPAAEGELTFILLHEARGRRHNWYWLTRRMGFRGLGYLALDLRGHGLSQTGPEEEITPWRRFKPPTKQHNDWDNMRLDIAAGVSFLKERGIEEESIALGGASVGGSIAIRYAALHSKVPLVFLLSPGLNYHKLPTVNALKSFGERPVLMVGSGQDRRSIIEMLILYEVAKRSSGEEYSSLIQVDKGAGTRVLYYNKGVVAQILDWIDDPIVEPLDDLEISTDTASGFEDGESGVGYVGSSDEGGFQSEGGLPSDDQLERAFGGGAEER